MNRAFWFYCTNALRWPLLVASLVCGSLLIGFVITEEGSIRKLMARNPAMYTEQLVRFVARRIKRRLLLTLVLLVVGTIVTNAYVKANPPNVERAP